jgi:hypothetical protein
MAATSAILATRKIHITLNVIVQSSFNASG